MKKVAIVGFGFMGMTHAENILRNENFRLVAIVDKNPAAVEERIKARSGNFETASVDADRLLKIKHYTSLDDCLEYEELDAVHVCVHTELHYEIACKALLHGKHVFLEKPFCLDIKQGDALIRLAREKERILMVGQVVRFMPPYRKLKDMVDSGKYGKLKFLQMTRFSGVPAWGEWIERRSVYGSSGGALFDLVIHDIDFVNHLLGMPGSIHCEYLPGLLSKHDYVGAWWKYHDRDITVRIEGGNIFHSDFPFQAGFVAQFEKASVQYSTMKGDILLVATDAGAESIPSGSPGDGFQDETEYFAQCIINNRPPAECLPESALQTIRLCYDHI